MFLRRPFVFVVCFFISFVASNSTDSKYELQFFHAVFRHGEKVPDTKFQNYPNDPYKNFNYYPLTSGDLTNQGKMREYKIGQMMRERYDKFIGPYYWPNEVYARSTEVPRTAMSLQLVLAGLFPPSTVQQWHSDLKWIPTYTFFVSYLDDTLLFPQYCFRYIREFKAFLRQRSTQALINRYQDTLTYLTKHTGKTIDRPYSVLHLYNLFKEQSANNLTLPEWTKTVYPKPMDEIAALSFKFASYTDTLKRLNGGMMLRRIVNDIEEHQAGKALPDRKAFLFSSHELNVAALVYALGINEVKLPAYGSTVIVETYRDKLGLYYIKVLLWTGVTEELIPQKIPGCAEFCPFNEFLAIVKNVLPNDNEYRCLPDEEKSGADYRSAANTVTSSQYIFFSVLLVFASKLTRYF
ncbi:venom acid phosphatase Acph-1-like [Pseudomyrmex gracilis]|uniref:venom acid phosphatase Acph-1-like n=1 Tax=Pseudomyrmex gracilis TaxID=219809 RepID=UPI0009954B76|nr:venom acid phosphatase Acph-1-like [Pseudomyrmex gracilis]